MNIEEETKYFKNHVAKLTTYDNIKILDFQEPGSSRYRIRFLFEEDYCKLHITGDLGDLIASNYSNMTFEGFSDFIDDIGYFVPKICCCSRDIDVYYMDIAKKQIHEHLDEDIIERIVDNYDYDPDSEEGRNEAINAFYDDVFEDFSSKHGIGVEGYKVLSEYIDDAYEFASCIGHETSGIISLYMLAFKLAIKQLKQRGEI